MTTPSPQEDLVAPEAIIPKIESATPDEAPTPPSPGRSAAILSLLAALTISFSLYAHTLGGGFVYDDIPLLVANDCHKDLSKIGRLFDFSRPTLCNQRSLRFLSFALDYALFGQSTFAYRAENLLLHGLVVWLALGVIWRFTDDRWLALVAAAFFLVHPIATEAVAYISGRRDLLAALFSLLAAWIFLPRATVLEPPRRLTPGRSVLGLLSLVAAFFSHEGTVTVPFALALLALARRWPRDPVADLPARARPVRPPRPHLGALHGALRSLHHEGRLLPLALGLLGAITFALWSITRHNPSTRHALWGDGLDGHLATVLRVHAHYLHQLLWPTHLLADYSPDAFPLSQSLLEARALLALGLIAGLLVGALVAWRRAPLGAAALLAYFGLLLPSSQIVIHQELAAEHRLYLPSLLIFTLIAASLVNLARRLQRPRLIALLVFGLLVTLSILTVSRAMVWTSGELLWSTTVAEAPRCARAHANLGAIFARQGRLDDAAHELERALALRPTLCAARENLGQVLIDRGHIARGIATLRRALRCKPSISAYRRLAQIELHLGSAKHAEASARAALRLAPRDVSLLYLRGHAEQLQGKLDDALKTYRQVLQRDPRRWKALLQVGGIRALRCELGAASRIATALAHYPGARPSRVAALSRLIAQRRPRCTQQPRKRSPTTAPASQPTTAPAPPKATALPHRERDGTVDHHR